MENFLQYKYLWIVFIILVIILIVVINKASKAVKKRYGIMNSQDKLLIRYKYLVDTYSDLTKEKVESAPVGEISAAIGAVVQRQLEKSDSFNEEFEKVPHWKQQIYAYDILTEFSADRKLSDFFRGNGEPIFSLCFSLFEELQITDVLSVMKRMYPMFDENNESVSIDNKLIDELDDKFAKIFGIESNDDKIKQFILKNL